MVMILKDGLNNVTESGFFASLLQAKVYQVRAFYGNLLSVLQIFVFACLQRDLLVSLGLKNVLSDFV